MYKNSDFLNRELSWLEFNDRVLDESNTPNNPLLEKIKFLSICSSNLDEFFMVRVAGLKAQVEGRYSNKDISGMTPKEQLIAVNKSVDSLIKKKYKIFNEKIKPDLSKEKINFTSIKDLSKKQLNRIEEYFLETLFPILTPMAIDSSRPFPHLLNKSFNLLIELKKGKKNYYSIVKIPSNINRFYRVSLGSDDFVLIEDIIEKYAFYLFEGYDIKRTEAFRITRNSDMIIDEEEADDLLIEIEKSLNLRKWGSPVRLEISKNSDKKMVDFLREILNLKKDNIYYIDGPIDLTFLMKLSFEINRKDLKFDDQIPVVPSIFREEESIFDILKGKEIILHHPYESFDPVIRLVKEASEDENVLAIKQTLYRVSGNSPIIGYLKNAANNGKQVTVLVEIKARFDEEQNIKWAKELERAGCHVLYGLTGLKTHAKCLLIVRKEDSGIQRYVHMSTGNYNDSTAKLYTDMGCFTTNENICTDISYAFNLLTGFSEPTDWNLLTFAPKDLRTKFYNLIDNEIKSVKSGKKGKIIIKVNSLVDKEMIEKFYEAAELGVEINLIVRGACCLRVDLDRLKDKIKVYSIVGRYLEHSRIFYFENEGNPKVFLSSADLMERNLNKRVELLFPILEEKNKLRIIEVLEINLKDNVKKRTQDKDGKYLNPNARSSEKINSQKIFYEMRKISNL